MVVGVGVLHEIQQQNSWKNGTMVYKPFCSFIGKSLIVGQSFLTLFDIPV